MEELRKNNKGFRDNSLNYGADNVVHFHAAETVETPKPSQSNTFSQFRKGFSNLMSMDFTKSLDDNSDAMSIRLVNYWYIEC